MLTTLLLCVNVLIVAKFPNENNVKFNLIMTYNINILAFNSF